MQRLTLREMVRELTAPLGRKVDRNTVHAWTRKGLPYSQPGGRKGRFFFDMPAVLDWIAAQNQAAAAIRERESVRGRMRRLVAPGPKPLTRAQERAVVKEKRNAANKAARKAKPKPAGAAGGKEKP